MKIIKSLSKILILATGLYLITNKSVAQTEAITQPSSCIASTEQLTLTQPNGISITIIGKGNLNNHWTETVDGYSVVKNTAGNYEYAAKVNGKLSPSGVLANNLSNRTFTESTYLSGITRSITANPNPLKGSILSQVVRHVQNKTFPSTGNIKVLALLIDYPDLQNVLPASDFDSLLYGANYLSGDGSFKAFYETSSGGQITIDVDVKGWYRAANNFAYYGDSSKPSPIRAADLVREAVDAANAPSENVNFSNYDNDNDGSVDGILAIHSGPGAEIGSQIQFIWSHRFALSGGTLGSVSYDGVTINDYMINPETRSLTNNSISGIGVFCHEFGHNLGLPDLYDTDNSNGDSEGIGNWCLMAGGAYSGNSNRPSNFSAWCREELGWDTPQTLTIGDNGIYSLPAASTSRDEIYRVNTPLSNEYFLLENRQLVGRDSDLPGSGLAIWHINTTKTNATGNSVNADETLKGVDLEEADGNDDLDNEVNRGDGGDLFPGTSNRTTFDDNTTPNAQTYTLANTSMQIRNIVQNAGTITFDFGRVPGPPCAASTALTSNTSSFDDGSGAGLEYVNNQTCSWLITPTSGTVTLSFSAFDIEPINDTVTVYDGNTTGATLLGKFSGNTIPASLTSSSNAMFVQFKSNATINGPGFDASYITNVPPIACSGTTTLTTATGSFSDGSGTANYTNNQNCSWLIQPAGAASITFGLTNLATEVSNDRITVYDGATNASPILGSFSGTNNLNTLTSSGGSIFVEFSTNATITDQGFDAFYSSSTSTAGCSGATTLTATSGSFSDGSMANDYNNNQFCSWLIQPPSGTITLSFSAFATETSSDRVLVFDGVDNTAPQVGNFSGASVPANLTSTSNSFYIEFRTNGTVTDAGWDASYINNVPPVTCSGTTTLTTATGSFSDGSGTANYTNNQNCSWLIQPAGAASITFGLTNLATEVSNDIITVYDGATNASPILGSYSGTNNLNTLTSSTGSMFVEFSTNATITDQGFDAFYSSSTSTAGCSGATTLTTTSGSFSDGSMTNNYNNNQFCTWLIQPPNGTITLSFSAFATETSNDRVLVFDGIDNTAPQIGNFSGSAIPASLTSSSNSLYIEFITNGTITDAGWDASYINNIPAATCSGTTTLTATSGTIEDGSLLGNYSNNLNCSWLIQPSGSPAIISFNMTSLDLAFGIVGSDLVTIYDGTSTAGTFLGSFTGTFLGNTVSAYSGAMFIEFTTDGSVVAQGWEGTFNSSSTYCVPQNNLTSVFGSFTDGSPTGQNYLNNTDCSWLIQPTIPNVAIDLSFITFDTEATNDTVTVYDGASISDPILATISGPNPIIPALLSSGGSMLVTFKTNGSTQAAGWEATYQTQAIAACNGTTTLTAVTGTFDDGTDATINYGPNSNCSWLIQPTGASLVSLNFNRFSTQINTDFVTVYDGANNTAPVLGTYSGATIPSSINSTGNSLFVEFTSSPFLELRGWEITYNSTNNHCFSNLSITNGSGNIADGSGTSNYQDNLACSWIIEPPLAASITATFNSFDVSNLGDTLFVYDGNSSTATRLAALTGTAIPAPITSTGNAMFVEFITDGSTNAAGWDFNYTTTLNVSCAGTTTLTAATATFDDGSAVTANYDNNLSCEWLIQPTGTPATITLNMNRINLLGGFNDRVRVYDNAAGTGFPIAQYFGTFIGGPAVSTTGVMLVQFITDGSVTGTGWEATYNTSSSFCQPNTTFTTTSGNFNDGSPFGQNYLNNTSCEWLIQPATPGLAVILNFFNFDTEALNDTVTIYDGATTAAPILGTFSGTTNPPVVTSSGGDMLVTFKSNGSVTANGWNAFYNTQALPACAGTTILNTVSGTFDDGSTLFANYVENSNCSWLIAPTGALNVDLTFNRFNTQLSFDFVNVYDGNSNTAPLLGSFSGATLPPVVNSTGSTLFVEFISNGFINATGWEASYISSNAVIIDVPQDTVFINAGAGSTNSLSLTSNASWSNIDNAAWLIASPVNGSGNTTINLLAVQANIGPERSAELIFNSATTADADTVIVIQRTSGRFIDVNPDTLFFAANAAPNQSATINSNVTWNLTPDQPWIMATPASGTNSGSSSIMVQNNTGSSMRTSFIVASGNLGAANDTIWIIQNITITSPPSLSVNPINITLPQAMGSTDMFTVNSNTTWQTTSGATWLTVTNPATTADTQMVQVTANSMNISPLPRASFVAVQDVAGTLFDTVFVFQAGTIPILIGAPDTILLGNSINSTGVLNIGSTGAWTAIEGDAWFSLSQTTGSGVTTVNLTTNSTNTNTTQRISYVALADAANSLTDTVVVIQDISTVGLTANPDTLKVGATAGSSGTFTVSSNLGWIATPSVTWLTVAPASGTGSGSVTVTADANSTAVDRIAFVEVSSTGGAINKDTVWVIQESFVTIASLEVNPSIINIGFLNGSSDIANITSNTSWTITNPASWLSVSSTSGVNDQTLTITATSDNLTGATRTAIILVDGLNAITRTITVNQIDGSSPIFVSSKDTVFVDNIQGSTGIFSILSNANSWTVSENTSWLLINPTSGSQTQTVTSLVATRNIFGTSRYANITGKSNGFADLTVVVAQKESTPIFQIAPDSILVGADSSDFTEFNISSNMPAWSIVESASWVRISPENGAFTQRVTATAWERNTTGAQRSVIATITAPPLVPQTIKIVQDTARTIGIESNSIATGLSVYPNPTNGQVTVELAKTINTETVQVQLFNLIGEQIPIQAQFNSANKVFLNLENQASGIYFISIQSNGEIVNRKLILTE